MGCMFTSLFLLGPRFAAIVWWAVQPARWDLAFHTWLWPLFGIVIAPWTTVAYVLVSPSGVHGIEWLWIILAVIADVAFWSGGAWGNRGRIPGSPGATSDAT